MGQNDYAVVVGIAHYPLFHADLGGPVNDARHFADWLITPEDQGGGGVPEEHVTPILVPVPIPDPAHPQATADSPLLPVVENILTAFEKLRDLVQNLHHEGGSEKRLYIYLAGHGFSVDTEQLSIEESVLLMSNAEQGFWPHFAGHYCAEWFVKSGLFQEVVLFMDCCRNEPHINFPLSLPSWGVSLGTGNANKNRARKFYGFATKWAQESREQLIDGMMQGVFTWSLLKALRGDITDNEGRITEKELKGSIYNSVRNRLANVQTPGSSEFQDPDFEGDDGWVFAQLASKKAPTAIVQIDFGQLPTDTDVELIDASHTMLEKRMPKDGLWQVPLPPGFYLLQIPTTGQNKFFNITGSDPLTVSLDTMPVVENQHVNTKVHLIANCADPGSEIFVIDSHFQRVTTGVTGGHGHLEADLDPGIYKIKFVAGFLIQEEYVVLQAGSNEPITVPMPKLPFSTSAPIKGTRTTQAYHEDNATSTSKHVHSEVGTGSQLFVFVRDLAGQGCNDSATGLTLHDLAGNLLVDFSKEGERDVHNADTDHWVGCTVQLDPGAYCLRVQIPAIDLAGNAGTLEQIVVTCPGWQTQVFLLRKLFGSLNDCQALRANLSEASMLMVPLGTGFQPESSSFREAELARQGLIKRRIIFDTSELSKMTWKNQQNPLLGIYNAHQILLSRRQKPGDLHLLHQMTSTLKSMIGDHPDVLALDVFLDDCSTNLPVYLDASYRAVYQAPPMLRRSWNILVKASITHPQIVHARSLASFVADRLWGNGSWLIWQRPSPGAADSEPVEPLNLLALHLVYPQILTLLNTSGSMSIVDFAKVHGLSNLERFLLEYIAVAKLSMLSGRKAGDEQLQEWARDHLTTTKLVQALHVPVTSINEATAGLVNKLDLNMF